MAECFVVVGTRPERDYIIQSASQVLAGLEISLIIISDTPVDSKSANTFSLTSKMTPTVENYSAIASDLQQLLQRQQLTLCGIYTALDRWVECTAWLNDHFQQTQSRLAQIQDALSKFQMRTVLSQHPGSAVEFAALSSSDQAAVWLESHPGSWVIKPTRGAGSRGVTTGIRNPDQARQAFKHAMKYAQRPPDEGHLPHLKVMIEEDLTGLEVDVELVMQNSKVIFAFVADNPEVRLPQIVESSSTYPSRMSDSDQQRCIDVAVQTVGMLGFDTGNFHVEMICTDHGPRIIEVNPRMGGAFVWHAIRSVYDVDLVELGILANLQKLNKPITTRAQEVIEAKFLIARQSGFLHDVRRADTRLAQNNVRHFQLWKTIGDHVKSPSQDASDYVGFILCAGHSHDQALQNAERALNDIRLDIGPRA